MSRSNWYVLANAAFCALVVVGAMIGSAPQVHPLYLVLLFALCSTPILNLRQMNDRYALLALYLSIYFVFYGVGDVIGLFGFDAGTLGAANSPFEGPISKPEWVILLGCACAQIAYRSVCNERTRPSRGSEKDWPESTLLWVGLALWTSCTYLSWQFNVHILLAPTIEATERGLNSLGTLRATGYILASILLQPLSIVILAYTGWRYRRPYMVPVLLVVVVVQLLLGFASDGKERALIGGVLVLVTKVLVDGKLPKLWIGAAAAFLLVAYPVLRANRYVRDTEGMDRAQVVQNLVRTFKEAVAARKEAATGDERVPSLVERVSLKSAIELIVARTGADVPYQYGYTLTPIAEAFIPRIVWPTKPAIETGQIMNQAFSVSDVADTYISPSHLGELYWNFGWAGVVVGTVVIGLLLGFVSARYNLADSTTITRMMVFAATIFFVIIRSEGSIATEYVNWLRAMLAIALLHALLARRPRTLPALAKGVADAAPQLADAQPSVFPNLLR